MFNKTGFSKVGLSQSVVGRVVLMLVMLGLAGLVLTNFYNRVSWVPSTEEAQSLHSTQKTKAEVKERFQQGVVMLHAKRYEEAVTAFHRVIKLEPKMPEAFVNMGYALLGLKQYKAARDFFDSATMIKPNQTNAYYGMAIALEGLNDLPGALGAMNTFVHLAPADDPYRTKAESAIWEWEEARKLQRQKEVDMAVAKPDSSTSKP